MKCSSCKSENIRLEMDWRDISDRDCDIDDETCMSLAGQSVEWWCCDDCGHEWDQ